jgi:hypothetical protein
MKKFEVRSLLALLLAMAMMFALVACGGDENTLPPDTVETDPVVTDPVETDPVEPDTESVKKIAKVIVSINGLWYDVYFTDGTSDLIPASEWEAFCAAHNYQG